ncbi:MAG: multidrug/biocide efflux PACE transporter [Burkholderiaceae bacterium]|nr:multidrug/biocide efflux PACE transporter [Burkholderiaceae bacterium]
MQVYDRSLAERAMHALLFEVLAIGISAPLAAWLTGKSILSMGVLTAVIATMALLWNMLYNWLFDRLQNHYDFNRTLWVRVLHACGFELGLIVIAVPFVAWWLDSTLWHALVVDIGLVLFYLPYAFFFNLAYDRLREKLRPAIQH